MLPTGTEWSGLEHAFQKCSTHHVVVGITDITWIETRVPVLSPNFKKPFKLQHVINQEIPRCFWAISIQFMFSSQGCTNLECQVAQVSTFYKVLYIYGSSAWNLLHITLLAPRILGKSVYPYSQHIS